MSGNTTTHGPHTDTPQPSTVWRITHRWGSMIGDVHEWTVRRKGSRVYVTGHSVDLSLDLTAAEAIGAALSAAAVPVPSLPEEDKP